MGCDYADISYWDAQSAMSDEVHAVGQGCWPLEPSWLSPAPQASAALAI